MDMQDDITLAVMIDITYLRMTDCIVNGMMVERNLSI
jgi:hypothetical protein